MTLREKIAGIVLLAIALIFIGRAWIEEHDARAKAEAVQSAQQQVIDQAQKSIDAAKADAAKTAADLQARLAAFEAQKNQPVTAEEFAAGLNKLLPNLPAPAAVAQLPAPVQVGGAAPALPSSGLISSKSAAAVEIPAADLPALRNYKIGCDETAAKLAACEQTAADDAAQLNGAKTQLAAMTKERDAEKTAAKGGAWLKRVGKRMKCLAISGGASALGAWADKQEPARGAAIGVTVGGVGCELF